MNSLIIWFTNSGWVSGAICPPPVIRLKVQWGQASSRIATISVIVRWASASCITMVRALSDLQRSMVNDSPSPASNSYTADGRAAAKAALAESDERVSYQDLRRELGL